MARENEGVVFGFQFEGAGFVWARSRLVALADVAGNFCPRATTRKRQRRGPWRAGRRGGGGDEPGHQQSCARARGPGWALRHETSRRRLSLQRRVAVRGEI